MIRSRFVRLALAMAVLPALVMMIVGGFTFHRIDTQLTRAYDLRLNDEIAALSEGLTKDGQAGLKSIVKARMSMYPQNHDRIFYGVYQDGNQKIIGELPIQDFTDGFIEAGDKRLRVTPISDRVTLAVGTTTTDRDATLRGVLRDLFIAALACLGLGLILGLLAARRFESRLRDVNNLIDAVAEGEVSARIEPDSYGDEISTLSARINTMLDRIQRLITLRKSISDQVAHEVRTPLTQLDAALSEAAETALDPKPITAARQDVKDCVSMLDGLLDVSALEAQAGDRQGFEVLDLSRYAQNICEFYEALAEDKDISLIFEGKELCSVMADADQIDRLIANLIDNAIKYTPRGGQVKVSTALDDANVLLAISDSGPGISPEYHETIFKPFFRQPGKLSANGHGLGLALVKAIAERHSAEIKIQKNSNSLGTNFTCLFPAVN